MSATITVIVSIALVLYTYIVYSIGRGDEVRRCNKEMEKVLGGTLKEYAKRFKQ